MERLPGRGGGSGASLSSERCLSLVLASESVSLGCGDAERCSDPRAASMDPKPHIPVSFWASGRTSSHEGADAGPADELPTV